MMKPLRRNKPSTPEIRVGCKVRAVNDIYDGLCGATVSAGTIGIVVASWNGKLSFDVNFPEHNCLPCSNTEIAWVEDPVASVKASTKQTSVAGEVDMPQNVCHLQEEYEIVGYLTEDGILFVNLRQWESRSGLWKLARGPFHPVYKKVERN